MFIQLVCVLSVPFKYRENSFHIQNKSLSVLIWHEPETDWYETTKVTDFFQRKENRSSEKMKGMNVISDKGENGKGTS